MSAREWQPGDVAWVTALNRPDGFRATMDGDHLWREYGDGWKGQALPQPVSVRPLMVIDPEDREQVERLMATFDAAFARLHPVEYERLSESGLSETQETAIAQAALREFANPTPPQPEEPTGPAARVVTADGSDLELEWARVPGIIDIDGVHKRQGAVWVNGWGGRRSWQQLTADYDDIRVLSEGVTA